MNSRGVLSGQLEISAIAGLEATTENDVKEEPGNVLKTAVK